MSKFKIYIFMFIIGFVCLALDVNVGTNLSYPNEYENSSKVTGEYQYNNIASNYNARCTYKMIDTTAEDSEELSDTAAITQQATEVIDKVFYKNLQVDIFNDFLGYLLIFIACIGFSKSHSRFKMAAIASALGFIIHGIIVLLPFVINGLALCNVVFAVGISYLGCFILSSFLVSSGIFCLCPRVSCRDERKWGKTLVFMILVGHILITFIYWLSTDHTMLRNLGHFFVFAEVCLIVIFTLVMKRTAFQIEENYKEV